MSEYWKSQPKKHCDFCKCWIAENKPSIDFHEKGKRHLENVKKKIDELKKKGLKDAKAQDEKDSDLARMERDALAALKRDLANDPSMAAAYGVKIKEKVHTVPNRPEGYQQEETETSEASAEPEKRAETPTECDWNETKSPDGYTYYWNKVTGETTWTKPDAYVPSVKKKKKKKKREEAVEAPTTEVNVPKKIKTSTNGQIASTVQIEKIQDTSKEIAKECNQSQPKETTRGAKLPVAEIPIPCASIPLPGAAIPLPDPEPVYREPRPSRPSAYGSWETVSHVEEPVVDYQLPTSNWHIQEQQEAATAKATAKSTAKTPTDSSYTEPPKMKFKEKQAAVLPTKQTTGIVFKKRKIGGAASNARKREDD